MMVTVILVASATPVLAVAYTSGVKVGQYVKYGNFIGIGQGFETFNDYGWLKLEITNVNRNEVTLLSTGQFKNGTVIPGNGTITVWNVATGTENGVPKTQGPIIAANLNPGDSIPPPNTYSVNHTQNAVYLGISRSINVLNVTISTPDYNTMLSYVYDRASGMLLESNSQTTTQSQPQPITSTFSYSIIDTDIFGSTPTPSPTVPEFPSQMLFLALLAFMIAAAAIAIVKKKQSSRGCS